MILFEETIRNEKSGNNIKGKLLLNVPDDMAQGLIDVMKTWKVVSKSPYSYSFYDITNKSWDDRHHEEFYRIADHWNFVTNYSDDVHCKTNKPVQNNKGYHLAKYNPKTGVYDIQKFYPYVTNKKTIAHQENNKIESITKIEPFEYKFLSELLEKEIVLAPTGKQRIKINASLVISLFSNYTYASWYKTPNWQSARPWMNNYPKEVEQFVKSKKTSEFTVVYWLKKENKEKLKTLLTKLK